MHFYNIDRNGNRMSYQKYWEFSVGSCHAATALRADYQEQLERCHKELGFSYVRFHGLFDDDMSVLTRPMFSDRTVACFANIDKIYDFLLSIGMKPFIELSFMPGAIASGEKTIFHYKGNTTPPGDYAAWTGLVREFVSHIIARYGRQEVRTWFFEVWNEPNLGGPDSPFGFWAGSKEEYFRLYKQTAEAVKSVDGTLKTGGPATSNNAWIPEFIEFCKREGAPLDFISTHHYPTDAVLGYGVEDSANFSNPVDTGNPEKMKALLERVKKGPDEIKKIREEYSVFQSHLWEHVDRGVLTGMAERAVLEAEGLPLYYTEWGSLAGLPSDGPFGASFIAKTALDNLGMIDGYSFWTFSDIFEESAQKAPEFHGGFGLLTQRGIAKAPYRAFELLHRLGGQIYEERYASGTVDGYAFYDENASALQILLVNHDSLLHPIGEETVRVRLGGVSDAADFEVCRIDGEHANALAQWERLGSPEYPDRRELCLMQAASELRRETVPGDLKTKSGCVEFELTLPPMGMALATVYL